MASKRTCRKIFERIPKELEPSQRKGVSQAGEFWNCSAGIKTNNADGSHRFVLDFAEIAKLSNWDVFLTEKLPCL